MTDGHVKSAVRALELLELFAANSAALGVSEVARRLGVPKSSAQALLATLANHGYLAREGSLYHFPQELRVASWVGGLRSRVKTLVEPILQHMTEECGESSFFGMLVGNQIQYVAKAVSSNEVRYDASLLRLRPAYCSSSGLVILAYLDPVVAKGIIRRTKLVRYTPHTVTDQDSIKQIIERTRKKGFVEVRNANLPDASGVAAPVFGPDGEVFAALSIGTPSYRYAKVRKQITEMVVSQAAAISRLLLSVQQNPRPSGTGLKKARPTRR
jgi:DNA-binding IclR family transcriptional regulator